MNTAGDWVRRRAWVPMRISGRWLWLTRFEERGHKVFVERRPLPTQDAVHWRRAAWLALGLFTALFWTLAIIGADTVLTGLRPASAWTALERPLPCTR